MTQTIKTLAAIAAVALLTTGCATKTWYNDPKACALAGAAIGGGAGMADEEDTAIVGALGGAVIGATVCALLQTDGDADGDGVADSKDQCPNSAAGVKVDALGCELDSDGDGVADSKDQCPITPEGAKVDANGCALDSDGDGVADYKDQCPNSPAGATVNSQGCQDAFVLEGVEFKLNSAELTDEAKAELLDDAAKLKANPDANYEVAGHTDSTGSAAYNKSLSQARAESVRNYLISQGASAASLTAVGYGEERPIADNSTEGGRQVNRRVELNAK
jgi:OOP family OmpA-OmpF porin